ncbi:gastrula zinc finger protein XlCGF57.1 isoform X28 [Plutella xylostella]|uniref:gastrula zinc finger protein XlCGF57.1 isoform X28 n=1 Tax=Plutella xylostella TaxID=51655 RepID=UPI0020322A8E|nr:gastrula zinc finger protein XlCGF57.1 isoform X28 [Plutella xylostella]
MDVGKSSSWPPGPTVCRCCLAEGCYKDISTEYFWMGKREVYAEMLTETFDLAISYAQSAGTNSNSRLICEPCISRLRDASEFKRQVSECERMFTTLLEPGSSGQSGMAQVTLSRLGKDVKVERVKVKKEDSEDDDDDDMFAEPFGDDDDDDDADDEPLTNLATKIPKKEAEDDIFGSEDKPKPAEKRKATVKAKAVPAKKAKATVTKAKGPAAKVAKPQEKKKRDETLVIERKNAEIILQYGTAYPFRLPEKALLCVYCGTNFQCPLEFRTHMQEDHDQFNVQTAFTHCKYEGYIKADCTELLCRICFHPCERLEVLAHHLQETHDKAIDLSYELGIMPFRLDGEKYNCYFCSKNFPGIRHLSRHLASHYLKFTCDTCGRSYISKNSLQQHMLFGHRGNTHICRKCKERFDSIDDFKNHMSESKACWMHVCNVCGDRFKGFHLKEQHLLLVHGHRKLFHCPECSEIYESRRQLRTHFKFAHTDEAVICSYCGQKFDTKRSLEDHIPVHTQEKLHVCDVCFKAFPRKKNLAQHMWIHREEKRFECAPCNKKFNQRISWRIHMKTHHPEQGVL